MLKHRLWKSFLSTVVLYALLGLPFFYLLTQAIGTEQKPKEKTISFSLSEYEPEVIPPVEEPIPEEVVEPEPIEPEPLEVVKEELIIEEVVPEPIVKKVIKKVVKKKPVIKKKKIVKKKVQKKIKKRVKKATKQKVQKKRNKAQARKRASPAQKNRFLNQLRGKINRNKAYPRIAQRRGMQGAVKVCFTILPNGQVGNISVSGPKVFHTSAKSAVKKAFPINVKNAPISLPKTVNVTLRYQIR